MGAMMAMLVLAMIHSSYFISPRNGSSSRVLLPAR
jgi:hypothetical protein